MLAFSFLLCFYWQKASLILIFFQLNAGDRHRPQRRRDFMTHYTEQTVLGPAESSTAIRQRCNGFAYVGPKSNTLCPLLLPYRPCPEHIMVLPSCFTLGTSMARRVTAPFLSLGSCQPHLLPKDALPLCTKCWGK